MKVQQVQFWISFGAGGPPGAVASRHFQDCKGGPCPSLTFQGLVLALLQMHPSTQAQGYLPTQIPHSPLLNTTLGPQDHRTPCSNSTRLASRAYDRLHLQVYAPESSLYTSLGTGLLGWLKAAVCRAVVEVVL